ncbi:gamma-glutamyltransferase [Streptomyces sp. NPDC005708]|uniref:gamma-glutamyltransferase n=1 Tax=Streptomyces sp. NPDC005708 TaxID=3154564 RepID=UPI0033F37623
MRDAPPLVYADSVDIPVLFRDGPAKRPYKKWRTAAHSAWLSPGAFPAANGWYLPTTTWRDVVKAATEVGRDVTPWLHQAQQLARSELVARVAPLYAYLGIHAYDGQHAHNAGRRLTVNAVYEHGTERTAKSALGYRLGMTMTEWACRSLMGLGQTWHIEDGGPDPALRKIFKDPTQTLPDLWGVHKGEDTYWLIEAKGGNVRKKSLDEGWHQLKEGSKIMAAYEHRLILCGASVQRQGDLFLTIDHDQHSGKPPTASHPEPTTGSQSAGMPEDHLGDSDEALMGTARAQMLLYLALRSAPVERLRTVGLIADRSTRRAPLGGLTTPLERDGSIWELRQAVRARTRNEDTRRTISRGMGLDDFLTYRIPGTELRLGMSRRLFAACAQLHREDALIAERTPGLRAEDQRVADEPADQDVQEERRRTERRIFRDQQEELRTRIAPRVRDAYEEGTDRQWRELLPSGQEPMLDLDQHPGLLEAATPETYLAVRQEDLPYEDR